MGPSRIKTLADRVDMNTATKNKSFRREHREMEQESNVESAYRAQTRRNHGRWPGVASGGIPS